jgi:hypothetical protein
MDKSLSPGVADTDREYESGEGYADDADFETNGHDRHVDFGCDDAGDDGGCA